MERTYIAAHRAMIDSRSGPALGFARLRKAADDARMGLKIWLPEAQMARAGSWRGTTLNSTEASGGGTSCGRTAARIDKLKAYSDGNIVNMPVESLDERFSSPNCTKPGCQGKFQTAIPTEQHEFGE